MKLKELVGKFDGVHVVVIGDFMLDIYNRAEVERLSPEAPVPVLLNPVRSTRPGGAGNVCANLRSLGARCSGIGVVGDDVPAGCLRGLLTACQVEHGLVTDPSRRTTTKERFMHDGHHFLRVDNEDCDPISDLIQDQLLRRLKLLIEGDGLGAVVLSTYDKGVLTDDSIPRFIELAREHGLPTIVDPKHSYFRYFDGVTVFKPNVLRLQKELDVLMSGDQGVATACGLIKEMMPALESILITRGNEGMTLMDKAGQVEHIRARSVEVSELSGAGDTVSAVVALGLAAGASVSLAANLANIAAGIVVTKSGTATVNATELLKALGAR